MASALSTVMSPRGRAIGMDANWGLGFRVEASAEATRQLSFALVLCNPP